MYKTLFFNRLKGIPKEGILAPLEDLGSNNTGTLFKISANS